MSEIEVGDLAVIVKPTPCCGRDDSVGLVFRVMGIETGDESCRFCHARRVATSAAITDHRLVDMNRIKRIPPLSELEGEKRDERIPA